MSEILQSVVEANDGFGDHRRFFLTLDLHGYGSIDLNPTWNFADTRDGHSCPDPRVDRNRGRKPNPVRAVVDAHHRVTGRHLDLGGEGNHQRKGQVAMSDRAPRKGFVPLIRD